MRGALELDHLGQFATIFQQDGQPTIIESIESLQHQNCEELMLRKLFRTVLVRILGIDSRATPKAATRTSFGVLDVVAILPLREKNENGSVFYRVAAIELLSYIGSKACVSRLLYLRCKPAAHVLLEIAETPAIAWLARDEFDLDAKRRS